MPGGDSEIEDRPSIYLPYGATGGGGQGGNYVFTDLDHLDRIITRWTTLRDEIVEDRREIEVAIQQIVPPADDEPSVAQAKAAQSSLTKGWQHNKAMIDYVNGYIDKLQATRTRYTVTEDTNVDSLRNVDQQR